MNDIPTSKGEAIIGSIDISDDDIYDAMKKIPGYLDITAGDFKEIYRYAYKFAVDRLTRKVKAEEVMTKNVVFVTEKTPVNDVAQVLGEHGISGVPVLGENGVVSGIITEKDFLTRMGAQNKFTFMTVIAECLEAKACMAIPIRGKTAGDIMTAPPVTVTEEIPIIEITALFAEKKINRVPVVDMNGRMAGIVSRADILRSFPL